MAAKKGGLGRGLDALFADQVPVNEPEKEEKPVPEKKKTEDNDSSDTVKYIKIHNIMPNADQPRKTFNEEKLEDLASSIKEHGVIQPIIVRKKGKSYEIVAGERRWRAAMKAELSEIPCIVREFTDEQNMLVAIIENMQREDLNPIEEAEGINQMIVSYGFTQEQVSKSVGKSRPYITNSLRLLKLPEYIKEAVSNGVISQAHGRTLLALDDKDKQKNLFEKIVKEGLSVRDVEKLSQESGKKKKKASVKKEKNPDLARVEYDLKESLGTKVNIIQNGKKGKIEIEYYSEDELERLIDILKTIK